MLRKDPFVTGEYYHIYNRGVDKRVIFKSSKDYERFVMLLYLANSKEVFRLDDVLNKQHVPYAEVFSLERDKPMVAVGAWCLMPNHFHLILRQEVDDGITKFMRKVGVGYAMFFNIKYQRTGALFGGLFKAKLVDADDIYLRQLLSYIHLNPLELKFPEWKGRVKTFTKNMKKFLRSYKYSSYLDYLEVDRPEKCTLNTTNFPTYFSSSYKFDDFLKDYFSEI